MSDKKKKKAVTASVFCDVKIDSDGFRDPHGIACGLEIKGTSSSNGQDADPDDADPGDSGMVEGGCRDTGLHSAALFGALPILLIGGRRRNAHTNT